MSPTLGVVIWMNNYFHDVATALLAASGAAMWFIIRQYELHEDKTRQVAEYFISVYKKMTRVARFALLWILLAGIPRTIFYREVEWSVAVGNNQIPAIIVKHIIIFSIVGTGVYMWRKFNKKIKAIRLEMDSLGDGSTPKAKDSNGSGGNGKDKQA